MATIRLVPSTYYLSNTQYLSISNASNMYANTDSNTYATVTNSRNQTTNYYIYIRGFNFSDIPSNVTINSFTIKIKCNYDGGYSQVMYLYDGDSTSFGSSDTTINSTVTTHTFQPTKTLDDIIASGSNFGIRINCRRQSRNQQATIYIYGAEIEIDYTPNVTYNIISTNNSDNIDSISPEGLTEVEENGNYTLNIYGDSIDNIKVEDNGVDVTNQLVQKEITDTGSTINAVPLSNYDTEFSASGAAFYASGSNPGPTNAITAIGYTAESPNPDTANGTSVGDYVYVKDNNGGGTATGSIVFNFDFSSIPQNAIIESVSVKAYGCQEEDSSNTNTDVCKLGVYSGNILKGTEENITRTSNGITTMSNVGTWTRDELQNAKLKFTVGYYGGRLGGITWSVSYSLPTDNPYYWTYTLSNIQGDHTIVISNSIIEIPEEDPQYNYYPITISSINATTDPRKGTTRVVEGANQTITIYPSESQITLVTDNGVDISSQLVAHGSTIPDPTVSSVSGASYGFTLNSSTGYYVSQNTRQASSAAVCRVTFDLPVRCLITIQYINYAEATYDYGIFGNIDVALGTTYTADSNAYKVLSQSSDNSANPQTLTYEMNSGEHYIDIKYRKDTYTDSNNDSLQFKILSIEPLEANNYYTYTLSNIQEEHSLIFIFGDVTYYFINSSGTNCKLFPSGSLVQLPGDNYSLTIVPDNYNYAVTLKDNNVSVTPTRKEEEITKDGNTYTVVNYVYTLTNIQATHNLIVTCTPSIIYYIKLNGTWEAATNVLLKQDDRWGTLTNIENIFTDNLIFYKGILYDYVLTNCVMNFDGINSYANRYQDTTSGFEGDWVYPNGISNNVMRLFDVTATGNSFVFNGTSSYIRPSASGTFDGFLYSSHTIEAYFELSSFDLTDGNAFMLYVGRNSTLTVALYCYYYSGSFYFIKSSGTSSKMLVLSSLLLNTKHYIAANANGWMFDGTYYPDVSSSAESNSAATNNVIMVSGQYACSSIGMRFREDKNPDAFNGILYAMRIHSSQLTEAEMRNNMNTDIQRYS